MTNDCHNKYKMTNHKKLAIENHTNLAHEFVGNSACILKEKNCPKKGSPLEPRYVGICTIGPKIFQTHTQKGGWYNFSYIKHPENNPENEIVRIHSQCI